MSQPLKNITNIMVFVRFHIFDAFIILLGIEQSSWKFGYSYDVTISDLNNSNTQGAHELSFAYKLPCRFKGKAFETINCPNF